METGWNPYGRMSDPNPAQRQLVSEHIDWATVESRLGRFRAIAHAFPLELLRSYSGIQPYYCHYIAWRLGTWRNEALFARLDELLRLAQEFPNWSAQASLLRSADFAEFWSLVWQLQVAEYLCGLGSKVCWMASGPDLSVEVQNERWFVECYVYRKSFGLLLFIEEVLRQVSPSIHVHYGLCQRFQLPAGDERSCFLDSILSPFRDARLVEDAQAKAAHAYPVILCQHRSSGLVVYLEGPNPDKYIPGLLPNGAGDTQRYLEVALNETLRAKQGANSLANHRPNLVIANLGLGVDFQVALDRAIDLRLRLPAIELGPNIDALVIATAGIDKPLTRDTLIRIAPFASENTALDRVAGCHKTRQRT